jgi:LAS superfamily LD-carboxypeptidase LdcB
MANTIYTTLGNNEGYGSAEFSSRIFTKRAAEDVDFVLLNQDYPFPAKGAYNAEDFERINKIFEYLQNKMNSEYGFALNLTIKTNWTMADLAQTGAYTAMENYRQNVVKIRSAITVTADTPQTPASMNKLTAKQANDIEKILKDVDWLISNMIAAYYYSGELFSGEV